MYVRYGSEAKRIFFLRLDAYRKALRTGTGIVKTSLSLYASLANVPKSYKRLVNIAFNTGGSE